MGRWNRILVRTPNWLGDAVMALPAIRALHKRFPEASLLVQARSSVAGLYRREPYIEDVIEVPPPAKGVSKLAQISRAARDLGRLEIDCGILLANSFESALILWLARIPCRIGFRRDGRGLLLTRPVALPGAGAICRHERFYYLELLRRAGLDNAEAYDDRPYLVQAELAKAQGRWRLANLGIAEPVIGVSPGAAYGGAKRWVPERFAEAAARLVKDGGSILIFGSEADSCVAEVVASRLRQLGVEFRNLAGRTTLEAFIDLAATCRLFISNDSGAMHVAAALGIPTVAVFGPTDPEATGPVGPRVRVVRELVECSPCFLRECPIDHRCMQRISADRVASEAEELLK